jgi:hypothetical protein
MLSLRSIQTSRRARLGVSKLAIEHLLAEHEFTPTQKAWLVEIQRDLEKEAE